MKKTVDIIASPYLIALTNKAEGQLGHLMAMLQKHLPESAERKVFDELARYLASLKDREDEICRMYVDQMYGLVLESLGGQGLELHVQTPHDPMTIEDLANIEGGIIVSLDDKSKVIGVAVRPFRALPQEKPKLAVMDGGKGTKTGADEGGAD